MPEAGDESHLAGQYSALRQAAFGFRCEERRLHELPHLDRPEVDARLAGRLLGSLETFAANAIYAGELDRLRIGERTAAARRMRLAPRRIMMGDRRTMDDPVIPRLEQGRRRRLRRKLFKQRQVPIRMLVPNLFTLIGLAAGLTAIRLAIEGRYELGGYAPYPVAKSRKSIGVKSIDGKRIGKFVRGA